MKHICLTILLVLSADGMSKCIYRHHVRGTAGSVEVPERDLTAARSEEPPPPMFRKEATLVMSPFLDAEQASCQKGNPALAAGYSAVNDDV